MWDRLSKRKTTTSYRFAIVISLWRRSVSLSGWPKRTTMPIGRTRRFSTIGSANIEFDWNAAISFSTTITRCCTRAKHLQVHGIYVESTSSTTMFGGNWAKPRNSFLNFFLLLYRNQNKSRSHFHQHTCIWWWSRYRTNKSKSLGCLFWYSSTFFRQIEPSFNCLSLSPLIKYFHRLGKERTSATCCCWFSGFSLTLPSIEIRGRSIGWRSKRREYWENVMHLWAGAVWS